MEKFLEKNHKIIIILMMSFMLIVSLFNAWHDGAIFDEKAHIPAGYSYVTEFDMRLNPEHPPLIKDLAGLPLIFMDLKFDTVKPFWSKDINGQWDAGNDLLWQQGNDADKIIFWSRLPIVILSIILGLFIFKWTRELAGITAGLFALAFYAFDPNILGHNHFVTTDLGIAAFMAFSFYFWIKMVKDPTWKNVALAGIFLGLVQLTKFSSIMLFPIFGLLSIAYPLLRTRRSLKESNLKFKSKILLQYIGKGVAALAISIILVWGVYFATIFRMPQEKLAETIEYYFPASDQSSAAAMTNKVAHTLNGNVATRPLSEYFLGIAMVFKRVEGGNGAYFMNEVSGKAFSAYFPTVFLIKEPLTILFFMLMALIITTWIYLKSIIHSVRLSLSKSANLLMKYIRHNIATISMSAFIILYAYISITGNLNIGLRHLFPIYPFAYILTAVIIFELFRTIKSKKNRFLFSLILIFFPLILISETVASYPSYMSYFNSIAGGPKNGYKYVTDSNADWGQDIKRLKDWINDYNRCAPYPEACGIQKIRSIDQIVERTDSLKIEKIRVNYFGGADVKYYLRDNYIDWWDSKRPIEPGWYAISTNFLQGSIYDKQKKDEESYRWIRKNKIEPVYQVGTSILIYYLTADEADRINQSEKKGSPCS